MKVLYYIIPIGTFKNKSVEVIKETLDKYSNKYLSSMNLNLSFVYSNNNGLLYGLDCGDFNSSEEQNVGDIMLRFSDILLKEPNIYFAQYNASKEMFIDGIPENYIVLLEEVLFSNMTLEEKKQKISVYIDKIETKDKKVLIIDPYLLAKNSTDEYKELIKYLFESLQFSKLNIVVDKSKYDSDLFNELVSNISGDVKLYFTNTIHDRYWISESGKGFTTGSSLNGIGKKVCRIDLMTNEEVSDIMDYIRCTFSDMDI